MTLLMRDQENLEKGRAEGRALEKKKIILNMLQEGFDTARIMLLADATEEEIESCRANM